jgi:hypothetical protein
MEDEVKTIINSLGSVFIASTPASPDTCITITPTGGYPRGFTESKLSYPTFQIKVRSLSYATGRALCDTVKNTLHGYKGGKFLIIRQQGDILSLGKDSSNRSEWSINFNTDYRG